MLDIATSNRVVAENLKTIISNKGLKQTVISAKSGYTVQEFNNMLNGRRLIKASDIEAMLKALNEYGVDANDLFR